MNKKLIKEVNALEKKVRKKEKFINQESKNIEFMKKQIADLENENNLLRSPS